MEKLAEDVCEQNPLTKFAHANAKLQMLTFVEAQMDGCRRRANPAWIKMTRMSEAAFQPPCKGSQCCKVADMVNEKMVCDGGTAAFPSCDPATCTWTYDCTNSSLDDTEGSSDGNVTTVVPKSVYYRKYVPARASQNNQVEYVPPDSSNSPNSRISELSIGAKVGISIGAVILFLFLLFVGVVLGVKWSRKKVETA